MRFIGLDIFRCVAIALVLLAHIGLVLHWRIGEFFGIPNFYWVSLGGIGVTMFLILSGTVLELQYGNKNIRYLQFIAKRFLRIYPVYYLSLPIGIFVYFLHDYYNTGHLFARFSQLGIGDAVLSITGGYAFVGRWGGPFIATSWYIAVIISMYILYPFLSRQIEKRPNVSIIIFFFISFLSRLLLGKYEILAMYPLDWFPFCRIFEFSLGIYLAVILPKASFNIKYLEPSGRLRSLVSCGSAISFPLFLVHYPLLFIINYLTRRGVNQVLAICLYLLVSLTVSWIILSIDKRFPRSLILRKIDNRYTRNSLSSG